MTRDALLAKKADIEDKARRNGLTAGLVVQLRQVNEELKRLETNDTKENEGK